MKVISRVSSTIVVVVKVTVVMGVFGWFWCQSFLERSDTNFQIPFHDTSE